MRSVLIAALFFLGFSSPAHALDPIPPKPLQGISDSAQSLSLSLTKSIERLLDEHQSLTNETVLVLTLKKTPTEETLQAYAVRVFDIWKSSTPRPTSAVVLIFDTEKNRFTWKAGVGFDSLLADRGADGVASQIANPELKQGRADRAILLSVRKFFELLESPVYVNGKFDSEIRDSGFYETFTPIAFAKRGWSWWIWGLLAVLITGWLGHRILTIEIHYTAAGWHRISGWENTVRYLKRKFRKKFKSGTPRLTTGGGISGSY